MEMVREVALVNAVGAQDPADFAFAVEAIRIQVERDFMPVWREYLSVRRAVSVVGYSDTKDLAPGSFAPILVVPSLGGDRWLGDHGGLELADLAWGRSQPISTVESHEVLELIGNPYGNRWVRLPSGMVVAAEYCDPTENDHYTITATVGGQSRDVEVSNFAYPAWFGQGDGPFDHMGLCARAEDYSRGYVIAENDDGTTTNVFGALATAEYRARVNAKLAEEHSRTYQAHARTDDRYRIQPGSRIAGHWWA